MLPGGQPFPTLPALHLPQSLQSYGVADAQVALLLGHVTALQAAVERLSSHKEFRTPIALRAMLCAYGYVVVPIFLGPFFCYTVVGGNYGTIFGIINAIVVGAAQDIQAESSSHAMPLLLPRHPSRQCSAIQGQGMWCMQAACRVELGWMETYFRPQLHFSHWTVLFVGLHRGYIAGVNIALAMCLLVCADPGAVGVFADTGHQHGGPV